MASIYLTSHSLSETKTLAGCFASCLRIGLVVGLEGTLGAGKSQFARDVIQALCGEAQDVPSPTFTLVQTYESHQGLPIAHMDLYRLELPEEGLALGIEDYFYEAANLVEWPSKLGGYWPSEAVMVHFELCPDETRNITFQGPDALIEALSSSLTEAGLIVTS